MDPSDSKVITMSSFIAGALLAKRTITSFELLKYMDDFSIRYNCDIDEPNCDFNKLMDIVCYDDNTFCLKEDNNMYDNYLYSLTNYEIREYFGIEEIDDIKIFDENKKNKKKYLINKIKRTKIYA